MKNWSIKAKLSIPLIIACFVVVVFAALSHYRSNILNNQSKAMAQQFIPAISDVLNADRDLFQARQALTKLLLSPYDKDKYTEDFLKNSTQAKERMYSFLTLLENDQSIASTTQNFESSFEAWHNESLGIIKSLKVDEFDQSSKNFENLRAIYDKAGEAALNKANHLRNKSEIISSRLGLAINTLTLFTITYLIIISYLGPKSISHRIIGVTDRLREINSGEGNLTQRIESQASDEVGDLCQQFNLTLDTLSNMIRKIRDETLALRQQSIELSGIIASVNHCTEDQGKALSSLAVSFHQSATATQEVASIATKTSDLTLETTSAVKSSIHDVQSTASNIGMLSNDFSNTFSTADSLKQNSSEIASVVETIKSIAEQTNLLALNAAIEAARAGEQGRGFAVVADEVRTLASRTQSSTNDIQEIVTRLHNQIESVFTAIANGREQLETTVSQTQATSTKLSEVSSIMDTIGHMTLQTAAATEEQSQVSGEINRNITLIEEISQNNISSVQKIQTIGTALDKLAADLELNVKRFSS